jgi:hypothetical protein
MHNILEAVLLKIESQTVTVDDFNLLLESMPESIRDRVRRKTTRNSTSSHIDKKTGHQSLELPSFTKRVAPKRKPINQQDHGRSKIAHRHSERTQERQGRYANEAKYISDNIGKPILEDQIAKLDKACLTKLSRKMLVIPGIDRDWLYSLINKVEQLYG